MSGKKRKHKAYSSQTHTLKNVKWEEELSFFYRARLDLTYNFFLFNAVWLREERRCKCWASKRKKYSVTTFVSAMLIGIVVYINKLTMLLSCCIHTQLVEVTTNTKYSKPKRLHALGSLRRIESDTLAGGALTFLWLTLAPSSHTIFSRFIAGILVQLKLSRL